MRARNAYAAPSWAAEQRLGGVGYKATLQCLAMYADENFSCYPGQERIADETEQSERTVRDQLAVMEEAGLFHRVKRYGDDGKRTSDRFNLDLDVVVTPADITAAEERLKAGKAAKAAARKAAKAGAQPLPADSAGSESEPTTGNAEPGDYRQNGAALPASSCRVTPSPRTPSGTPSPAAAAPSVEEVARKVAKDWWDYYKANIGLVVGGRKAWFSLVSTVTSGLEAGYAEGEVREALGRLRKAVPPPSLWQDALSSVRSGRPTPGFRPSKQDERNAAIARDREIIYAMAEQGAWPGALAAETPAPPARPLPSRPAPTYIAGELA